MQRLQKVISEAGIASRRKAEQLIIDGQVMVNGKTVTELGFKVDPLHDQILVNGKEIKIKTKKVVVLLNKPKKVITSMKDPQGRKTVIDLIRLQERIYPVGRLDYDTEGLLLLTNDGELANRLMHPRFELDKTYEAIVAGNPSEAELDQLRKGIQLEEGVTSPAKVEKILINKKNQAKIKITIHEGRNRQVRRMFQAIGHPVVHLKRIQYGFLTLSGVSVGKYRFLSEDEICQLKQLVSLSCN
ncbi:pseudouridine synthase [Tepidibacillus fermentans]|uniref:Pseudouridine synthase n=1 Tax=Tepidibacillus fermentans TaxID=1281767 RepID=A0A4R3KKT2_9BACI|nr:pseudouridine synthase [Tepidibacillus fermentans]TCS84100.1 23S rRNA pseudouridine2605 synthase [Tepidibacillus fermentans]